MIYIQRYFRNGNIGNIGQQGNGNTQGAVGFSEEKKEETTIFVNGNITEILRKGNGITQGVVNFSEDEKGETRNFVNGSIE